MWHLKDSTYRLAVSNPLSPPHSPSAVLLQPLGTGETVAKHSAWIKSDKYVMYKLLRSISLLSETTLLSTI